MQCFLLWLYLRCIWWKILATSFYTLGMYSLLIKTLDMNSTVSSRRATILWVMLTTVKLQRVLSKENQSVTFYPFCFSLSMQLSYWLSVFGLFEMFACGESVTAWYSTCQLKTQVNMLKTTVKGLGVLNNFKSSSNSTLFTALQICTWSWQWSSWTGDQIDDNIKQLALSMRSYRL